MDLRTFLVGIALAAAVNTFGQPVITNEPVSQTNIVGSVVTLAVGATGTPPLSYQWRKGGGDVAGRTNAILVFTNVQAADAGNYTVVVSNFEGSVTSAVALVRVIVPPVISETGQPTNFPVLSLGASVSNRVVASGTAPFRYQWRRDGTLLADRTNATVGLPNLQVADVGDYTVVVTNLAGSITSQVARLTVDPTFTKIIAGNIVTDLSEFWNGSWADYDNDGFLDLFVGSWWNSPTNHLYHNHGDGTFTHVAAANIPKVPSNQHGSTWGDFDNDGYVDLFVTAGNPEVGRNVIYRNNGNGTFIAITNGPIYQETTTVDVGFHGPSWADYDNDGFLDLFIAGHTDQNRLFRNNGDGTFARIVNSAVVTDIGASEGRAWMDYDNDGHVDLFTCNTSPYRNTLHRNNGDGTFTKITNSGLTSSVDNSFACAWGDFNNDGYLDVFLVNDTLFGSPNTFYRNNGDGTFTRITASSVVNDIPSGIRSLACVWGDYDNDGFLDLFVSTCSPSALVKQLLFHNNGNGTFTRVLEGSLVNDPGCSQAASWADYDNDGFLDLFVANGAFWARSGGGLLSNFLYRNNGNSNRWLTVRLIGTVSNRSAIGAKVRVRATVRGQSTWQVRQILGGESQSNQQPLDAHFGLGDATNTDLVRIEWPSGTVQEMKDVAVNQFLTVTEPPRLMSARLNAGVFGFTLKGGRGFEYRIESSSNLQDWVQTDVVIVTNFVGTATFIELADTNGSMRVLRAVSQ